MRPLILTGALLALACSCESKSSMSGGTQKSQDSAVNPPNGNGSTSGGEQNPDDTGYVPPQTATGAFLVCGTLSTVDPNPNNAYYGCNAIDANKKRINLKDINVTFTISDANGNALNPPRVTLPTEHVDVSWDIDQNTLNNGVEAQAAVPTGSGQLATLKQKDNSGITIDNCTIDNC